MEIVLAESLNPSAVRSIIKEFGEYLPDPISHRIDVGIYSNKILRFGKAFIAMHDKNPVGIAAMYANDTIAKAAYISLLSVSPNFWGQGIGSNLVKTCIKHAEVCGMHIIRVQALSTNEKAIKLYHKAGFHSLGVNGSKILMESLVNSPEI